MTKRPGRGPLLTSQRNAQVDEVVNRLLGRSPDNALSNYMTQLDVSRPNFHDSKAAFQAELEKVEGALADVHRAMIRLDRPPSTASEEEKAAFERFRSAIDQSARRQVEGNKLESVFDLIRKNKADVGFHHVSLWALFDLIQVLRERLGELKLQEKEFWTVRGRPPQYYARTIALRLAQRYAREKGRRPTFGTARDGGHPSTDFGRALEEIFSILGIKANVRRAAESAIGKLTDEDLEPFPMGSLLGQGPLSAVPVRKARGVLDAFGKVRTR